MKKLIMLVMFIGIFSGIMEAQIDTADRNKTLDSDVNMNMEMQDDVYTRNADRWINNINPGVNLTADQRRDMRDVLIEYQTRRMLIDPAVYDADTQFDELRNTTNDRMNEVFNDTQIRTWETHRTQWWNDIDMDLQREPLPQRVE